MKDLKQPSASAPTTPAMPMRPLTRTASNFSWASVRSGVTLLSRRVSQSSFMSTSTTASETAEHVSRDVMSNNPII